MWVGVHVSAARCLLTYVLAPLAGGLGGILGPVGLLVQVLGTVTAIAGARRLWQMQHRGRYAYCAVAIALTLVTAAATSEHLLEGRT
jgi:ABC-type amino acid transport system permease subunit